MKKIFFILFLLISLVACEKDINIKLNDVEPVLVVDAQIENGQPPIVILSKSLDYFTNVSPQIISASFVHNADVFVSNGVKTHKLKEYSFTVLPGFTGYVYTIDTTNIATAFLGELKTAYQLKIISEGKEYTSNITIPGLNDTLDSMWVQKVPNEPDTNKRLLYVRTTDAPGRGNYIRYFTKLNGGNFNPPDNSVFDDQVVDGTTFTTQLSLGYDQNYPPGTDINYLKKGDTITVKYCNIDKSVYTFWSTWEFSQSAIGNPFSQPNKVIGNISNGALGVFSGYGAVYKTIIAN